MPTPTQWLSNFRNSHPVSTDTKNGFHFRGTRRFNLLKRDNQSRAQFDSIIIRYVRGDGGRAWPRYLTLHKYSTSWLGSCIAKRRIYRCARLPRHGGRQVPCLPRLPQDRGLQGLQGLQGLAEHPEPRQLVPGQLRGHGPPRQQLLDRGALRHREAVHPQEAAGPRGGGGQGAAGRDGGGDARGRPRGEDLRARDEAGPEADRARAQAARARGGRAPHERGGARVPGARRPRAQRAAEAEHQRGVGRPDGRRPVGREEGPGRGRGRRPRGRPVGGGVLHPEAAGAPRGHGGARGQGREDDDPGDGGDGQEVAREGRGERAAPAAGRAGHAGRGARERRRPAARGLRLQRRARRAAVAPALEVRAGERRRRAGRGRQGRQDADARGLRPGGGGRRRVPRVADAAAPGPARLAVQGGRRGRGLLLRARPGDAGGPDDEPALAQQRDGRAPGRKAAGLGPAVHARLRGQRLQGAPPCGTLRHRAAAVAGTTSRRRRGAAEI